MSASAPAEPLAPPADAGEAAGSDAATSAPVRAGGDAVGDGTSARVSNELAVAIRSGPAELNLSDNIFFRRRSLSNPAIFDDFLQALRDNTSIEAIRWRPRFSNNLTTEQRLEAFRVIGQMSQLKDLELSAPITDASPVGEALRGTRNLTRLKINTSMSFRFQGAAQQTLVQAVAEGGCPNLQEFEGLLVSDTIVSLDPLLEAMAGSCPLLRRFRLTTAHPFSGRAVALLTESARSQLEDLELSTVLPKELAFDYPRTTDAGSWSFVARALTRRATLHRRREDDHEEVSDGSPESSTLPGGCSLRRLRLATASADAAGVTQQVTELADAIRQTSGAGASRLEQVDLECTRGFTDDACQAVADAVADLPPGARLRRVSLAGENWRGSDFRLQTNRAYAALALAVRQAASRRRGQHLPGRRGSSNRRGTSAKEDLSPVLTVWVGRPNSDEVVAEQAVACRGLLAANALALLGRQDLRPTQDREGWVHLLARINGLERNEAALSPPSGDERTPPPQPWAIRDDADWEAFQLECLYGTVRENPLVTKRVRERRKESLAFPIRADDFRAAPLRRNKGESSRHGGLPRSSSDETTVGADISGT